MTKVLIAAGGEAERWENHLNVPKHFAPIMGEPLIYRIARLFSERGCDVVVIGPDEDRYQNIPHTTWSAVQGDDQFGDLNKIMSCQHEWSETERTVIVFGDVYFTEDAVDTIVNHEEVDWTWFGRNTSNKYTGKKWAEGFALSFSPQAQLQIVEAVQIALDAFEQGAITRCIGWEMYRAGCGKVREDIRGFTPQEDLGHYVNIHDWTDDFDFPNDYSKFLVELSEQLSVSVLIPYREVDSYRKRALEYVLELYRENHPDWEIIVGTYQSEDRWCKAEAVHDAFLRSTGNILVVADADTWCESLTAGVSALISGASWVIPHDRIVRFTEEATELIYEGKSFSDVDTDRYYYEKPYPQQAAGSASIIWRRTYERVPIDPGFLGWGGEDHSWLWSLDALVGPYTRVGGSVWHLWHPIAPRPNRKYGFEDNFELEMRYKALRYSPEELFELVRDARRRLNLPDSVYEPLTSVRIEGKVRRIVVKNRRGHAIRKGGITFPRRSLKEVVVSDMQYKDIKTSGSLMVLEHLE